MKIHHSYLFDLYYIDEFSVDPSSLVNENSRDGEPGHSTQFNGLI